MTQPTSEQLDVVREKAWARIGRTPWHQMAWFVKLANSNLADFSEGDIKNWLEECQAIHTIPISFHPSIEDRKRYPYIRGDMGPVKPGLTDLEKIHTAIKPHLNRLADGEETSIGPILLTHKIRFRRSNERECEAGFAPTLIFPIAWSSRGNEAWRDDFLIRMSRLLEEFADSIRRCPHCKNVFLQVRKNSRYCGKGCYTVAGMRKLRAEQAMARRDRARKHRRKS